MKGNIEIPREKIAEFCRRWHVAEFAFFGSVLRDDFRPESDVDVLVDFEPGWTPGWDIARMQEELEEMLGRSVDLVTRRGLQNPFRRHEILRTRQVIYDTRAA